MTQLRAFVGPQLLLDILRVHVCTSSATRSKRRSSRLQAAAAVAASAAARASARPECAPDGAVICRPVSPKRASVAGEAGGEGNRAALAAKKDPLERCIGACMRMLQAMLSSELAVPPQANKASVVSVKDGDHAGVASSSSPGGGAAGGSGGGGGGGGSGGGSGGEGHGSTEGSRDSLSAGTGLLSGEAYSQLPFLEGGFGDGMEAPESGTGGGREFPGGEGGEAGAGVGGAESSSGGGIEASVVCLQECHSYELQRGLLEVLLGLRDDRPVALRRELLR